jgi:hypothetical protein
MSWLTPGTESSGVRSWIDAGSFVFSFSRIVQKSAALPVLPINQTRLRHVSNTFISQTTIGEVALAPAIGHRL